MLKREVIKTDDGSSTIFIPDLNECYHSTHGAINESMHIFIDAGFRRAIYDKTQINILEVGFGTGLNALLTVIESLEKAFSIFYQGIEPYPVYKSELDQINYPEKINNSQSQLLFEKIHQCEWETPQPNTVNFNLLKTQQKIEEVKLPDNSFDLVYFDAFAPTVQPDLWQTTIFEKIFRSMREGGILVTYSCKGDVKRAMKACGFVIEKLPGPTGKREFLRATKVIQ